MDNTLVIGLGEVGRALHKVLLNAHSVHAVDKESRDNGQSEAAFDVVHICFPYSESFIEDVEWCQWRYEPGLTVIHSTVPVGTSRQVGAVHSPVMGLHPNLEQSLTTFTKFCGGAEAGRTAQHLMRAGIRCYITDTPEATELVKLLSTTFYGLCIEWAKHVDEQCNLEDVPFELWSLWTAAYNDGYTKLGHPEFLRPSLIPIQGKIGGHCVLPNLDLMADDPFVRLIRERNH